MKMAIMAFPFVRWCYHTGKKISAGDKTFKQMSVFLSRPLSDNYPESRKPQNSVNGKFAP